MRPLDVHRLLHLRRSVLKNKLLWITSNFQSSDFSMAVFNQSSIMFLLWRNGYTMLPWKCSYFYIGQTGQGLYQSLSESWWTSCVLFEMWKDERLVSSYHSCTYLPWKAVMKEFLITAHVLKTYEIFGLCFSELYNKISSL